MHDRANILFVDDEIGVLDALQRMFRHERKIWNMEFVDSAAKALDRVAETRYDVIISDMRMPYMDGASFLKTVREKTPETVRFILSGQADELSIIRAAVACHQYHSKPCLASLLRDSITRSLQVRELIPNLETRERIIGRIAVPSLPTHSDELHLELNAEKPNMGHVAEIVSCDVGLCAKYLQLANSAMFGDHKQIQSTKHLGGIVSAETLWALVNEYGFVDTLSRPLAQHPRMESAVRRSNRVADFCRSIAKRLFPDDAKAQFHAQLSGFLHEIGTFLLVGDKSVNYLEHVIANAPKDAHDQEAEIISLEIERFHCTRYAIGSAILTAWGCPTEICQAIGSWGTMDQLDSIKSDFAKILSIACWMNDAVESTSEEIATSASEYKNTFFNTELHAWCETVLRACKANPGEKICPTLKFC